MPTHPRQIRAKKPRPRKQNRTPKSSARRKATRNAPPTSDEPDLIEPSQVEEIAPAEPAPIARVPRRHLADLTPSRVRAAQNLLDAVGRNRVIETLRLSGKSKALQLADLLQDGEHDATSFQLKLTQVGLPITDFTDLLLDVKQAQAVARLVMSSEEVAESLIARATDHFKPHTSCLASGRILDDGGNPTAFECFDCQGSGYMLVAADREWVELYLELVKLRKNQPVADFSKKYLQQNLNLYGDLTSSDGAPSVDSIIKRADEQRLQLPAAGERIPAMSGMPEDEVADLTIEAEVVEAVAVEG